MNKMHPPNRLLNIVLSLAIALMGLHAAGASAAGVDFDVAVPVVPDTSVNLTNFAAVGDGVNLNTEAFAQAIAALSAQGGGELIVPSGYWLTGPIQLQSNINLHLERGALIQFSRDFHFYPLVITDMKGEKSVDSTSPISGVGLENVAITGEGIIDGGGDAWRPMKKEKISEPDWKALVASGGVVDERSTTWWPSEDAMKASRLAMMLQKTNCLELQKYEPAHQFLRPKMVRLIGCRKVLLEGVTFENPPNWTVNPALCEDVTIRNINVHNSYAAQNSDALDVESCRRVIVRDSTFDAGDDGICLKSGKDAAGRRMGVPDEDILIERCTVYHAHGGFVIGSEMSGGMRNIYVDNCTFIGTDNGLRFKSARGRGGVVEKIFISNVRMENILENAIGFEMFYENQRAGEATATPAVDTGTPRFHDIRIENLVCHGAHKAMVLDGLPEMPIRNCVLKNVGISAQLGASVFDADDIHFDNVRIDQASGEKLKQTRVKNSSLDLAP
ncbi:MAG TPA: glycoside hydrolase family 28 protein [Candidatus Acidoferrales bacterium]|jgi:polygalacturonase|nr:glycoside hydrolase family 28 protein [Candidatus Acidoferrales bacterium]